MKIEGLAGVILAAGASSRMGTDKALLELPVARKTFLGAQIESLTPHCELVVVVAGRNAEQLKRTVYAQAAELVINPDPDRGQFSSLQVGLQAVLDYGRDKALITHVDRLPAGALTIDSLKKRFSEVSRRGEKWMVVPEFESRHGHPVIAGREMIEAWLKASLTATAREVEHAHQPRIEYFPVADPNVLANVNTPDEYQDLLDK